MSKLFLIPLFAVILLSGCTTQYPTTTTSSITSSQITSVTSSSQTANTVTTSQASQASQASVTIQNFAFSPETTTIKVGGSITWTNKDSAPHTITSDNGTQLNSQRLSQSQSYSHTFNQKGTYNYHCSVHPGMKGTIIVE